MYGWLRRYEVEVAEYIPIFLLRGVERATFLRPEKHDRRASRLHVLTDPRAQGYS